MTILRYNLNMVRDKSLLEQKHALTTLHTSNKMEKKMKSHLLFLIYVTNQMLIEPDVSYTHIRFPFMLKIQEVLLYSNQKCMLKLSSIVLIQR